MEQAALDKRSHSQDTTREGKADASMKRTSEAAPGDVSLLFPVHGVAVSQTQRQSTHSPQATLRKIPPPPQIPRKNKPFLHSILSRLLPAWALAYAAYWLPAIIGVLLPVLVAILYLQSPPAPTPSHQGFFISQESLNLPKDARNGALDPVLVLRNQHSNVPSLHHPPQPRSASPGPSHLAPSPFASASPAPRQTGIRSLLHSPPHSTTLALVSVPTRTSSHATLPSCHPTDPSCPANSTPPTPSKELAFLSPPKPITNSPRLRRRLPAPHQHPTRTDLLIIASLDGSLHGVDTQSGKLLWSLDAGGPVVAARAYTPSPATPPARKPRGGSKSSRVFRDTETVLTDDATFDSPTSSDWDDELPSNPELSSSHALIPDPTADQDARADDEVYIPDPVGGNLFVYRTGGGMTVGFLIVCGGEIGGWRFKEATFGGGVSGVPSGTLHTALRRTSLLHLNPFSGRLVRTYGVDVDLTCPADADGDSNGDGDESGKEGVRPTVFVGRTEYLVRVDAISGGRGWEVRYVEFSGSDGVGSGSGSGSGDGYGGHGDSEGGPEGHDEDVEVVAGMDGRVAVRDKRTDTLHTIQLPTPAVSSFSLVAYPSYYGPRYALRQVFPRHPANPEPDSGPQVPRQAFVGMHNGSLFVLGGGTHVGEVGRVGYGGERGGVSADDGSEKEQMVLRAGEETYEDVDEYSGGKGIGVLDHGDDDSDKDIDRPLMASTTAAPAPSPSTPSVGPVLSLFANFTATVSEPCIPASPTYPACLAGLVLSYDVAPPLMAPDGSPVATTGYGNGGLGISDEGRLLPAGQGGRKVGTNSREGGVWESAGEWAGKGIMVATVAMVVGVAGFLAGRAGMGKRMIWSRARGAGGARDDVEDGEEKEGGVGLTVGKRRRRPRHGKGKEGKTEGVEMIAKTDGQVEGTGEVLQPALASNSISAVSSSTSRSDSSSPGKPSSPPPAITVLPQISNTVVTNVHHPTTPHTLTLNSITVTDTILGLGSHGTVVLLGAFQGHPCAVKRLLVDFYSAADRELDLLRESDRHPNVVRYFAMEKSDKFLYLALELCPASLYDVVEMRPEVVAGLVVSGPGSVAKRSIADRKNELVELKKRMEPQRILRQIVSGIGYLHSLKIVHRDIKPQIPPRILISDFGLSKRLDDNQSSFHNTLNGSGGTIGWRAPECIAPDTGTPVAPEDDSHSSNESSNTKPVLDSGRRITKAVDIFSAGCVFYYVLTDGDHPFGDRYLREGNILKGNYSVSRLDGMGEEGVEAMDLIERMIRLRPAERPTAAQVITHPYFWTPSKRLAFLQEVSDRFEIEEKFPPTPLLQKLESRAPQVVGNDWYKRIDRYLVENLGKYRKYDGSSIRDLLRALRNKKHHYQDLPEHVQRALGALPEGFLQYFTSRFPNLLLHAYYTIADDDVLRQDARFREFFDVEEGWSAAAR
ncbi:bifunctional endoribonuclease/protein kinase ire1 [Gonapodya sp. JEL0774]|nr:bifunctional endoribonuclease/protein kinase ire1 [Gonapodya sp. JEL0774]